MNFALSQRQPGRHPVGLMVVVGLHVLVGAALFTAKLHSPPAPPTVIGLKPIDPTPPKVERPVDDKLPPPRPDTLKIQVPVPIIDTREPDPIKADPVEPVHPVAEPPVVLASAKGDGDRHEAPHFAARRTVLDAGALQCRPGYPSAAQRVGAEGVSRIRFTVDALGRVVGAEILHPSGPTREHRLLDRAAAEALAKCPVTMGVDEQGRPVGGTADVEYVWKLN